MAGAGVTSICLHGPESSGKSTVGPRLAKVLGGQYLPEYGRDYAEAHGTDFIMADLVAIGQGHDAMLARAMADGPWPVVTDTDPLMTAVWADMLFGTRDPWFARWNRLSDFYLLFAPDLPWIEDGTRLFGTRAARQRFFDLSRAELDRRGVRYALIEGQGESRYANCIAALEHFGIRPHLC
ncbi:N-acetylglucosamine-6-phosphate isomerase [Sphingomonas yabuuchiae]|uniref:N-acetylglucosamine-6-phosphate isomerase n=1 Tax=Sphingomonas yabuuchiae TaxID=172044 RepID=A0A147IVC8_9SPHN|nr:N-acetylglucosamine-6-phosphate isomerase [Sphingomonas yabuuchiae]